MGGDETDSQESTEDGEKRDTDYRRREERRGAKKKCTSSENDTNVMRRWKGMRGEGRGEQRGECRGEGIGNR